jgi:hypothetical protein
MPRHYNMVARGERESKADYLARFKQRMADRCTMRRGAPLVGTELFQVPFGALELRPDGQAHLLGADGEVVGTVDVGAAPGENIHSFGGLGRAILRAELDPMDEVRAVAIIEELPRSPDVTLVDLGDDGGVGLQGRFTADQLEAIVWWVRNKAGARDAG